MRDFEVPYEVDAMISIGDSMNYITCVDDLENVFSCVRENLKENGVFIFDLKTIHFFRDILADNTYAQNRDDSAFIWDNYYDDEERNNARERRDLLFTLRHTYCNTYGEQQRQIIKHHAACRAHNGKYTVNNRSGAHNSV